MLDGLMLIFAVSRDRLVTVEASSGRVIHV
jgi:hypothetical protein